MEEKFLLISGIPKIRQDEMGFFLRLFNDYISKKPRTEGEEVFVSLDYFCSVLKIKDSCVSGLLLFIFPLQVLSYHECMQQGITKKPNHSKFSFKLSQFLPCAEVSVSDINNRCSSRCWLSICKKLCYSVLQKLLQ